MKVFLNIRRRRFEIEWVMVLSLGNLNFSLKRFGSSRGQKEKKRAQIFRWDFYRRSRIHIEAINKIRLKLRFWVSRTCEGRLNGLISCQGRPIMIQGIKELKANIFVRVLRSEGLEGARFGIWVIATSPVLKKRNKESLLVAMMEVMGYDGILGKGTLTPRLKITLPSFDNSELIKGYQRPLIGRCMNPTAQEMNALLFMMPRIWKVEDRVAGADLGMERFQFDFDEEEDIQAKRKKTGVQRVIKELLGAREEAEKFKQISIAHKGSYIKAKEDGKRFRGATRSIHRPTEDPKIGSTRLRETREKKAENKTDGSDKDSPPQQSAKKVRKGLLFVKTATGGGDDLGIGCTQIIEEAIGETVVATEESDVRMEEQGGIEDELIVDYGSEQEGLMDDISGGFDLAELEKTVEEAGESHRPSIDNIELGSLHIDQEEVQLGVEDMEKLPNELIKAPIKAGAKKRGAAKEE
ncbi:unnamed protein product [Thlaspi arvense]|uniref:Uncharacterized protein n=1 Tax=Thlaspi arvense TaxID=13288 RepID=A0AAU9T1Y7_THLAR|nr:unnamed protein product [Thlaspi arvense]